MGQEMMVGLPRGAAFTNRSTKYHIVRAWREDGMISFCGRHVYEPQEYDSVPDDEICEQCRKAQEVG